MVFKMVTCFQIYYSREINRANVQSRSNSVLHLWHISPVHISPGCDPFTMFADNRPFHLARGTLHRLWYRTRWHESTSGLLALLYALSSSRSWLSVSRGRLRIYSYQVVVPRESETIMAAAWALLTAASPRSQRAQLIVKGHRRLSTCSRARLAAFRGPQA
jgi:hypothetical protein